MHGFVETWGCPHADILLTVFFRADSQHLVTPSGPLRSASLGQSFSVSA